MHVHLREDGTLLQIEGNIDDCPSQYCQEKHDRAVRAETQRDELAVKFAKLEAKYAKLKAKNVR